MFWRAETSDPAWVRPSVAGLLLTTALLYVWGLGASGWANSFYSAAAQAGSQSWKAFFYGSSDAGNSITVDKTPASLWVMVMSVRVFGLSSWSILLPQAVAGVASVGVLYATVRRWFGPAAGLLAGAVLATTPVATLMFRFNNPDALLVLLLVLGAYATIRAIETASTRWLILAGIFVGFGFLTKMLQAFLVLPAFAAAYLMAGPTSVRRRAIQAMYAGLATLLAAGWWVAIVELVPARYRPYIGGSQHNSVLELALGYNGLGRITGNETGSVGGGMGWGQTGWSRLLAADIGGQVAWLLPAALLLLGAGLVASWRGRRGGPLPAPGTEPSPVLPATSSGIGPSMAAGLGSVGDRTSNGSAAGSAEDQRDTARTRAAFVLWGGWLVVTALTFSFMQGIFHAYYTVALAPAIGALVAMGLYPALAESPRRVDPGRPRNNPRVDGSLVGRASRSQP
jgi:4-amino-4-deoxy-L-arabinose transferase-like glycosyltransferase